MDAVLITGGAGFIGSHLAQRLLAGGTRVTILDNFDPFYDPAIKHRNIARLRAAAKGAAALQVVEGDLRDSAACGRALEGVGGVVHLAALAGVRPSIADPVRYMDVNVTGTQVLLQALGARPDVPFVFGSSSSVYGGNQHVPFRESDSVDHPVSPYAASKKAAELVCHTFHHLCGNAVTCLRFFTVYGPGQRPEMVIHAWSRRLLAGQPLPFFGDGSTRRDYTYVDDIVDGIVAALERADGYRIYNLGGAATTTLARLVEMLEAAYGQKAVLERLPDQQGDVRQTFADVSLAERELGYHSRIGLAEGLARFAKWYVEERGAGRLP